MITGRWMFTGLIVSAMLSAPALAMADGRKLKAKLQGFEEVPAISTTGSGEFRGRISKDQTSLDYELSYSDLQGGSVLFAHIHLGQRSVNGGVIVFLCSNSPPMSGIPACPTPSGTVTGTVTASNVIGPAGQGITAGEFAELLNAIRKGVAYANVHTGSVSPPTGFPGGEIRGQIRK